MVMAAVAIDHIAHIPVNITNSLDYIWKAHHGHEQKTVSNGAELARQLIGDALRQRVESINHEFCEPGEEDTFFVADLGEVYRQHMRWKLNLPRVKPFYAVKCNPDPVVLRLLAALGTGFDCASKAEIEQVLDLGDVDPSRIIYAQPCKTTSYVRYVRERGVEHMTFDNADELRKIARLFPQAKLLLRISTDDSSSLCRLSLKFGAPLADCPALLDLAASLGLDVVGVSFHVGSGASDPGAFVAAVRDAAAVFDLAYSRGFEPRILDVGGGFSPDGSFEVMASALRDALDEHFPAGNATPVDVIAEPGRYYVASAFTLACNVIARRAVVEPVGGEGAVLAPTETADDSSAAVALAAPTTTSYMLYVNDGLYGNFSSIMFDHQQPVAKVLRAAGRSLYDTPSADQVPGPSPGRPADNKAMIAPPVAYSIWGPTCDGIDRIAERAHFDLSCAALYDDAATDSGRSDDSGVVLADGASGRSRSAGTSPSASSASLGGGGCHKAVVADPLPPALDVGDWLYFEDMGAYTRCSATRFNGFSDCHDVVYVCSEVGARAVLGV